MFKVKSHNINKLYLLKKGDIILSKTSKYISILIDNDTMDKITATSHFLILRVVSKKVNPEYLAWYLNQKDVQNHFHKFKQGMLIPTLSKSMLEDLMVTIPCMDTQNKIDKINNLYKKEMKLIEEYKNKKRLLIKTGLLNLVNKEEKNQCPKTQR